MTDGRCLNLERKRLMIHCHIGLPSSPLFLPVCIGQKVYPVVREKEDSSPKDFLAFFHRSALKAKGEKRQKRRGSLFSL